MMSETCQHYGTRMVPYDPADLTAGYYFKRDRDPCGRPAEHTNYADQGRYAWPVCWRHYDAPGSAFKGPEDL